VFVWNAAAHMFLEADWRVYATARNPADIETLGERGCQIATLDVTDGDDIDRVVDRIEDESGSVSCLVNNAGFGQFGAIEDIPTSQVHRQFDVNLYGPHRLIRAVLPKMRENEAGTIINISSVAGQVSFPTGGVYAGSKAALEAMSDALRNEVAPYDIDVVIIEPGPVETAFPDRAAREFQDETKENSIADDTQQIERSGAYESLYELLTDTKLVGGGGFGAVSAERVAEDILDAASSTSPQPRYQTGATARVGVLARFVPSTWRDTLYQKLQSL
jgi:NAD(P)-dependent dehydrogenase (short-subunit alcohol dehydrogenase family)